MAERALTTLLERPAAGPLLGVDVVCPELLSGRAWAHEPTAPRHGTPGAELDRLLAAGVEPLARAAAASRQIVRLSAVVAGSLAEFARLRPAALFDRQPGERGAMSAATRASRPRCPRSASGRSMRSPRRCGSAARRPPRSWPTRWCWPSGCR